MYNNTNQQKPPAFPLTQPASQQQFEYSWNSQEMPWKSAQDGSRNLMLFNFEGLNLGNNGCPTPAPIPASTSGAFMRQPRIKRKSESDDDLIPSKHYISEDKMVAHMNGLHITSETFQQHNVERQEEAEMEAFNVNLTAQELDQRLKNAQRITVCDQVRKSLREDNEIIPKVLLDQRHQPCRALMIWRAPLALEKLVTGFEDNSSSGDDGPGDDPNNNNDNMDEEMDV